MNVRTNVKAGDDQGLRFAPPDPGGSRCWDKLNHFMDCCKGDSSCLR